MLCCGAAQVAADTQVDHLISHLSQLTQQDAAGSSGADMEDGQGGAEALISEVTTRLVLLLRGSPDCKLQ